jgi:photosystem II stability/assembly factor-like uncharacterized protein
MEKNNASQDRSDRKSFALLFWLFLAKIGLILLLVVLVVWLIQSVRTANQGNKAGVTFGKVLGAAYSSDGNQLRISTAKGVAVYEKGSWKTKVVSVPGAVQLVPVEGGFFALKAHKNAVLRTDNGRTTASVHLPAQPGAGLFTAAYATRHLYFLNGEHLYSSANLGKSWNRTTLRGVQGEPQMLAASPNKSGTLAVATRSGLYVTEDQGRHFKPFLNGKSVTAVSFGPSGKTTLFAGLYGNQSMLYSILPQYNKEINLDLDTVKGDPLVQIARNPRHPQTTTVITAKGDAYLTENGGQNWTIIAKDGRGLSQR